MLLELTVTNLGLFERAQIGIGPGVTALTGETGAGKSLILGAISLLLGGRADAGVVRPGAAEAIVDGRFEDSSGAELILTRVVPADGRSRAYCNGRPVTVAELAQRTAGLVELHAQHEHQRLLEPAAQRNALDRYCGVDLTGLESARQALAEIDSALAELGGDERMRAREQDLLSYQLAEISAAQLDHPNEDEDLDGEETLLADAVQHRSVAHGVIESLTSDDGVNDLLGKVVGKLRGHKPFEIAHDRLAEVMNEMSEVASELRSTADSISDDPERLDEIRLRRQLFVDLRRKYGDTLAEVMAERDRIADRIAELAGYEARVAELEASKAEQQRHWQREAALVAQARRGGAAKLGAGIQATMRHLAMPNARVEVAVQGADPANDVTILLAANPGSEPAPLAKVASGGELSRATLAVRLELTAGPPTLIFDEIDAGIGGEAALSVGRALAELGQRHQVLVVTHLPQVAAFASTQAHISKRSDVTTTTASVELLDEPARVAELARMLSGSPDSDASRQAAGELLALRMDM